MALTKNGMIGGRGAHARAYHEATKHSWESVRAGDHSLDWQIKPLPFKIYPDLSASPLPRDFPAASLPAEEAIARVSASTDRGLLDLVGLAQLLFFAAGLTKKKVYPGGEEIHFRAAASTGALYEVEVYVIAGTVSGLEPGVYHFCPLDFSLRQLREGDHRAVLAGAASAPEAVARAPATLVLSALYWRNTWKYRTRAFRHFFWDAGTLLANLLATAVAADLPARILLGFADGVVNQLLGLDDHYEGSLALVPLGTTAPAPPPPPPLPPLTPATVALSSRQVDCPLVREVYRQTSLQTGTEARAWAERLSPRASRNSLGGLRLAPGTPATVPLGEVILRRGSTRQFGREPIAFADLSAILDDAVRDLPLDAGGPGAPLVDCYLLAHAVEGLPSGSYVLESDSRRLRTLRGGAFRADGGFLCLEQSLGADASVVVFFLADLAPILDRYGDRGYRAVNLAAGLLGGRMYLAAYARGLGASGSTFYDDAVTRFFSPDAASKDAIFATALGRPFRDARPPIPAFIEGKLHPLRPGEQ